MGSAVAKLQVIERCPNGFPLGFSVPSVPYVSLRDLPVGIFPDTQRFAADRASILLLREAPYDGAPRLPRHTQLLARGGGGKPFYRVFAAELPSLPQPYERALRRFGPLSSGEPALQAGPGSFAVGGTLVDVNEVSP